MQKLASEQDAGSVAVVADADVVDEAAHQVDAVAAAVGRTGRSAPGTVVANLDEEQPRLGPARHRQ